jgi:hypothetical protein
VFKGRSTQPLVVLSGFGPIVAVVHRRLQFEHAKASTLQSPTEAAAQQQPGAPQLRSLLMRSPPPPPPPAPSSPPVAAASPAPAARGSRLLIVNSEGDLFSIEVSRPRARLLARALEAQLTAEGRSDEPGAAAAAAVVSRADVRGAGHA